MPNNQIINKQAQIESAREFVRASRTKLIDFETQLQQLHQNTGSQSTGGGGQGGGQGGGGQSPEAALLRQWDDEMDLMDGYLANLEAAISGYAGIQEIQNYGQLQSQFIGLKNSIRTTNMDIKKANEALRKIEKTEARAILELNDSGFQTFVANLSVKIQTAQQLVSDLQRENPLDNDAVATAQVNLDALQAKKQARQQAQSVKQQLLAGIEQEKTDKLAEISQFSQNLGSKTQALEMNVQEISNLNDPRYLVNTINDDTPFLLLPVRVETRYMDIKHVRRTIDGDTAEGFSIPDKKELWVRIFPDDIAINTHEKRLTLDEEQAGQLYWSEYWAAYLLLLPDPPENAEPKLGPWRVLAEAYGSERAAWIAKQTEPTNLLEADPVPTVLELIFPVLEIKDSAWTEAAKSYVMPDRFVVRLYKDEFNYREITGSTIPDPLQVGMDPSEELESSFEQDEGEVNFPEEIKWLRDFKEAKNIGMGISIPLEPEEEAHIHRILVLGLKLSADKTEATNLFEELIENHHYTTGGFSLIPQGTPTNNTEGLKSGYEKIKSDNKESLKIEGKGPLFIDEAALLAKSDGQWFADLIGIDQELVQNVFHANGTDICEAIAMNRALWPATMGYFMKQMMHPHVSTAERNRTRDFFNQYVLGRGKIPAFRVDNQPYGVITSTAFNRWEYGDNPSQKEAFYNRLNQNMLRPMSSIWERLANINVKHVKLHELSEDPSQDFLDMMGLHSSSVEFYQRFANGAHKMWNLYRFINSDPGGAELPAGFPVIDASVPGDHVIRYNSELAMSMEEAAKVFELNFLKDDRHLNGPVIDGFKALPYSEERGILSFPDTGWNYIHWLTDPSTSMSRIKAENFDNIPGAALDQKPPKALLYLLLRHAYLQEYLNTSTGLIIAAGKASSEAELEIELQGIVAATGLSAEEKAMVLKSVTEEVTLTTKLQIKQQVEQEFQTVQNVQRHQIRTREGELLGQAQSTIQQTINSELNNRIAQYKADTVKWDYLTKPVGSISGTLTMEEHIDSLLLASHPSADSLAVIKESIEKLKGLPTARLERAFAEHLDLCNYRLDAWMTGMVSERLENQQSTDKGMYLGAFGILENLMPNTSNPGIHVVEVDGSMTELDTSPAVTETFTYLGLGAGDNLERDLDSGKVRAKPQLDDQNQGYIHAPSVNHAVTAAILRAGFLSHKAAASDDNAMAVNLTSKRIRRALYYLEGLQNGQTLPAMLGYRFERELHDRSDDFVESGNQLDKYILDFRLAYPLTTGGVLPKDDAPVENQEARNVLDGLALLNDIENEAPEFEVLLTTMNGGVEVLGDEETAIRAAIDQIQNDMDAIADLLLSESVYQLAKGNIERSGAVLKILGEGGYVQEPEIIKTPRQGAALTHRFGIQFKQGGEAGIWTENGTPRSFSEPALNSWLAKQLPAPEAILFNVEYDTVAIDVEGEEIITVNPLTLKLSDLEIEPIDFVHLMGDQGGSQDATELSTRIAYFLIENEIEEDGLKIRISYTDTVGLAEGELSLFQILPLVKELKSTIGNSRPLHAEDYLLAAEASVLPAPDLVAYLVSNETSERLKKVVGLKAGFDDDLTSLISALGAQITTVAALIYPADPEIDPVDPANEAPVAALRTEILKGALYGVSNVYPSAVFDFSEVERDNLISIATRLKGILSERLAKAEALLDGLGSLGSIKAINDNLHKAGQAIFGRPFKVFPHFKLINNEYVATTRTSPNLLDEVGDMAVEEWTQSVAKVKPNITNYQKMRLYSDSLTGSETSELIVTQLPIPLPDIEIDETEVEVLANLRWIGMTLPEGYDIPADNLSLVLELPILDVPDEDEFLEGSYTGMVLDEWVETIPYPNVHTGMAMHYNEPNAEAANSLIMAVTPKITGQWKWDDLMDTLNETLSLAKKRAVEPDHLKDEIWGQTLPALLAAISPNDSTPSLDFARNVIDANNGQYGYIAPADYAVE